MDELVKAMLRETQARTAYLEHETIDTIYFGGGTPSLLPTDDIHRILDTVAKFYTVNSQAEVTLEANPDDLTYLKILELARTAVNRLSIGIQSFRNEDLVWMNRAHNASQADYAVKCSQDRGFNNITISMVVGPQPC